MERDPAVSAQAEALAAHLQKHFPRTTLTHYMGFGVVERVTCGCESVVFSQDDASESWAAHVAQEWCGS